MEQLAIMEISSGEKPTRNLLIHSSEHFEHPVEDKVQSHTWKGEQRHSEGLEPLKHHHPFVFPAPHSKDGSVPLLWAQGSRG